jgi:SAM-dependent methyltransferase
VPQNIFTGSVAEDYDRDSSEMFERGVVRATVGFLVDAARGGTALEFGVGTGRIALPLSQSGVGVHGIDISPDMVAQLRTKAGSDAIGLTIGDFATTRVEGTFSLVYLVYNTIGNLTSQAEQIACFRNAAAHLAPGGRFVIELGVPDLRRFPPGAAAQPFEVSATHLGFDTMDTATQQGVSHHYLIDGDRVTRFDCPYRYAWPAELDLMARLADLELRERWADWDRSPFTAESRKHISVWERPRQGRVVQTA